MEKTLIRIACKELKSFYLADLQAVGQGLPIPKLAFHQNKSRFRKPDDLSNLSHELNLLTRGEYQKVSGSRAIVEFLDLENEYSTSFYHLIQGNRRMVSEFPSHTQP